MVSSGSAGGGGGVFGRDGWETTPCSSSSFIMLPELILDE
jgi:hypothetical protein